MEDGSELTLVARMKNIISNAEVYGQFTSKQRVRMGKLIRKNGGIPKRFRQRLWKLA
jgi:hypothetical protein